MDKYLADIKILKDLCIGIIMYLNKISKEIEEQKDKKVIPDTKFLMDIVKYYNNGVLFKYHESIRAKPKRKVKKAF